MKVIISVNSLLLIFYLAACADGNGAGTDDVIVDDAGDRITDTLDDTETGEEDTVCVPTEEQCNGIDDDCDGVIDNGFDLLNDSVNCGACGWVCELENATARCENGACWVESCEDGYFDVNGDPSDGCEYVCSIFATNEYRDDGTCSDGIDNDCDGRIDEDDPDCMECVPEFCDYIDNDCDGLIDEDFDLRSDPNHCGNCTTICPDYPRATGVCVMGSCYIICEAGYTNLDGIILNGCEAICNPDADPNESICDGIDNDCDGITDEDYVPYLCGTGACMVNSICWDGEESCVPTEPDFTEDTLCNNLDDDCDGMVDEEYIPSDACTGYCRTTATCVEGEEICGTPMANDATCDGVDDDCDGVIDDDYVPYTCGSGACTRQSTCIEGVENCNEGAPSEEICNGSDDNCDGSIDNGPISTLCPTTPPHGTAECEDGICVIDTCDSGWYDIDNLYHTGCECQVESTEPSSTSCAGAHNLGNVPDDTASISISGNIVPSGDSDWYRFNAVDSADISCDAFHVDIRFTSNPGNAFRIDVYSGSCSDTSPCLNEQEYYDWYTDYRTGSGTTARGECPCTASPTVNNNICNDDTETFYIRVFKAAGATVTCNDYSIEISNSKY